MSGRRRGRVQPATPTNFSLVFGDWRMKAFSPIASRYHCWIEVDGWVIDLMALLFDEMAPIDRKGVKAIPSLDVPKPLIADVSTLSLDTPGAYLHVANHRLTTN
jgi:hypothetical protein